MTGSRALGLPSGMDPEHGEHGRHPNQRPSALSPATPPKATVDLHPQPYPHTTITAPRKRRNSQIIQLPST